VRQQKSRNTSGIHHQYTLALPVIILSVSRYTLTRGIQTFGTSPFPTAILDRGIFARLLYIEILRFKQIANETKN
jgi:hypothetical protein